MPGDDSRSRSRGRGASRNGDRGGEEASRSRSASGKRGHSGGRSDSREEEAPRDGRPKKPADYGVDTMKITDDDAAFILGKGGKTKMKIARVSQAEVELYERDLVLEFRGSEKQRRHAKRYARCVMAQRTGPVHVDERDAEDDCTLVDVPQTAVGFVTGKGGNFLRTMEEEWGVIMFFAEYDGRRGAKDIEKLAIFGERPGRRGAQLKTMSAVETKVPGFYTESGGTYDEKDKDDDWGTSTMRLKDDELSYALGKKGMTRKKIARSSECIVEYVSNVVFMSGTRKQRNRAKQYMKWLFDQLEGPVVVDTTDRDDCTVVDVPVDCVGYVTGNRRETLGRVEEEWGSLMFFMEKRGTAGRGASEKLLIFGNERARKGSELAVMSSVENKSPGFFTRGLRERESDKKGFDVERLVFRDDELSYALGREGTTRKKLALSSNAVLQYVGHTCFIAGTLGERKRCRDYITWLLEQRRGKVTVDTRNRTDVTEVHVPQNCMGWVTGNRGSELRRVEQESGTFCFMANDSRGEERLLIFGHDEGTRDAETGRIKAERLINELVQEKLRSDGGGRDHSNGSSRSRSPTPYGRGRRRSRSDSRRRRR